ncbi:serine/arginine-rich SC35-like splicing factor SCL28 isoform X2 [Aristolochia californica]|uniref:serine/arginine-rich SC35-like splicing factor SCL28 isoform X2 n=1 Tax=Aristolochia californica TaxID=171875 RepID=UPI0035D56A15
MGRYRSRSRSHSPRRSSRSPSRRKRYDDPRERYRGGRSHREKRSSGPTGLLVRNISLDARPEDLRKPFERFGPVKDVYLPKNYYTGEPRGFGFVKFRNADDAAEAKQQMNHQIIGGREISIVYAEENRKTPQEMRSNARVSKSGGSHRRRSPPRSPRRRYRSYSRSPSPRRDSRDGDRSRRDDYYSPRRSISRSPLAEQDSRSPSPLGRRESLSARRSLSPGDNGQRSVSPRDNGRRSLSPTDNGQRSGSPRDNSGGSLRPRANGERSPRARRNNGGSLSPRGRGGRSSNPRGKSRSPSPSRS